MKYKLSYYIFKLFSYLYLLFSLSSSLYLLNTKAPTSLYYILLLPNLPLLTLTHFLQKRSYRAKYVDKLSGEDFEVWLKAYFKHKGYHHIHTTKKTRDYGADLIMKKWTYTYVVQAKRYDNNIGVHAIQEALAAKAYYKADKAIVVTNRYFTYSATTLAKVNEVELIDRYALFKIRK